MDDVFKTDATFADLGLRNSVLKGCDEAGFKHPTHIQAMLIPVMLTGRDVMGQAKTGTGKTAAFGLPLLHMLDKSAPAQAVVLAPTRELAVQITAELNELGKHTPIRAASIVGGEGYRKQIDALKHQAHIVVGTPGRVMDLYSKRVLKFDAVKFVVLDEVDRMLDIGFREDIRKILGKITGEHQTVFVSATISDEIERLARSYMRNDVEKIVTVAKALTVDLVTQKYLPVKPWDKRRLLLHLLKHEEPALTLVFCRTKQTVSRCAKYLQDKGVDAYEIHGDLRQQQRNRIMQRLREGKLEVLVASDLASRGLDVEGITHVINYDLPEDPELYVHRIGRTARAGREGIAWSFVMPDEGQRLTEIEKLTGVHIEQLHYPDFVSSEPPPDVREAMEQAQRKRESVRSRYDEALHSPVAGEAGPVPDPALFPGGVVPKGPPPKTLGSRFKSRRGRR